MLTVLCALLHQLYCLLRYAAQRDATVYPPRKFQTLLLPTQVQGALFIIALLVILLVAPPMCTIMCAFVAVMRVTTQLTHHLLMSMTRLALTLPLAFWELMAMLAPQITLSALSVLSSVAVGLALQKVLSSRKLSHKRAPTAHLMVIAMILIHAQPAGANRALDSVISTLNVRSMHPSSDASVLHYPSRPNMQQKTTDILNHITNSDVTLGVLTETRRMFADIPLMRATFGKIGYRCWVLPATEADAGAGLLVYWHPGKVQIQGEKVLHPGRAGRCKATFKQDGSHVWLHPTYMYASEEGMSSRNSDLDKLIKTVTSSIQTHPNSIAVGDFNSAPTTTFYQQVSPSLPNDKRRVFMRHLCDQLGMMYMHTLSPTGKADPSWKMHAPLARRIDHIIMSNEIATRAHPLPCDVIPTHPSLKAEALDHAAVSVALRMMSDAPTHSSGKWKLKEVTQRQIDKYDHCLEMQEEDQATSSGAGTTGATSVIDLTLTAGAQAAATITALQGCMIAAGEQVFKNTSATFDEPNSKKQLHNQRVRHSKVLKRCRLILSNARHYKEAGDPHKAMHLVDQWSYINQTAYAIRYTRLYGMTLQTVDKIARAAETKIRYYRKAVKRQQRQHKAESAQILTGLQQCRQPHQALYRALKAAKGTAQRPISAVHAGNNPCAPLVTDPVLLKTELASQGTVRFGSNIPHDPPQIFKEKWLTPIAVGAAADKTISSLFSRGNFEEALKTAATGKAVGPDNFHVELLQLAPPHFVERYQEALQTCATENCWPP